MKKNDDSKIFGVWLRTAKGETIEKGRQNNVECNFGMRLKYVIFVCEEVYDIEWKTINRITVIKKS